LNAYRLRAQANDRSLEEELRSLLTQTVMDQRQRFAAEAKALREHFRAKYGQLSDSTPGTVQDRQERG
jgi:plasmid stability protein